MGVNAHVLIMAHFLMPVGHLGMRYHGLVEATNKTGLGTNDHPISTYQITYQIIPRRDILQLHSCTFCKLLEMLYNNLC